MWIRHWRLSRDPFLDVGSPYVAVAPHEEAVARLVATIESGQRRAVLRAGAGLGKSIVLARVLTLMRNPRHRVVLLASPIDGEGLLASLAEALGRRVAAGASHGRSWRALDEAIRLCRWQRLRVILAIDNCQYLSDPADRLDLERLAHLDPHPETRLTVVQAFRADETEGPANAAPPWELSIRLPALTRSDAEVYLTAKLASAGRDEPTFTPRAIHRLHADSAGNPRGLDRLASLALMAGALRGQEIVTPDIIEGVVRECTWNSLVPAS